MFLLQNLCFLFMFAFLFPCHWTWAPQFFEGNDPRRSGQAACKQQRKAIREPYHHTINHTIVFVHLIHMIYDSCFYIPKRLRKVCIYH